MPGRGVFVPRPGIASARQSFLNTSCGRVDGVHWRIGSLSSISPGEFNEMPAADDAERRIAPRTRVLKRAKVLFNNMNSTFDCVVRNISASGALLTLDESAHLPREFDVRIGEDKGTRPARLVYRRGALAGIRFLDVMAQEESTMLPFTEELRPAFGSTVEVAGIVRKLQPERLPSALTRHFRWG